MTPDEILVENFNYANEFGVTYEQYHKGVLRWTLHMAMINEHASFVAFPNDANGFKRTAWAGLWTTEPDPLIARLFPGMEEDSLRVEAEAEVPLAWEAAF